MSLEQRLKRLEAALRKPAEADAEGPVTFLIPANGRHDGMPIGHHGNIVIYDPDAPPPEAAAEAGAARPPVLYLPQKDGDSNTYPRLAE